MQNSRISLKKLHKQRALDNIRSSSTGCKPNLERVFSMRRPCSGLRSNNEFGSTKISISLTIQKPKQCSCDWQDSFSKFLLRVMKNQREKSLPKLQDYPSLSNTVSNKSNPYLLHSMTSPMRNSTFAKSGVLPQSSQPTRSQDKLTSNV